MAEALVVGAGVFGLSVAREFAGRGWSVRLIDQQAPGTSGPSSARLRILRCASGADEWYSASAWRARTGWQELAAECGRPLFVECGVLLFASGEAGATEWERASLQVLRRLDIPVQRLAGAEVADRFADLRGTDADFAVYEPAGGVLRARSAVLGLRDSALGRGVQLLRGQARPAIGGVLLDGRRLAADLVVWAVGVALPALFPGLTSVVEVSEGMVELPPPEQPAGATAAMPAWVDRNRDAYCLPALDGLGERIGPVLGPSDQRWRQTLRLRQPDRADVPVPGVEPCSYANTPDRDFLLAALPDQPQVWLVGGDSGHGFKHGPAWASYVCDVVEQRVAPLARFGLS